MQTTYIQLPTHRLIGTCRVTNHAIQMPPPQKGSSLAFVIEPVVQKSAVLQTSTVITAAILGTAVTLMTNYAINLCLQPGAYAVNPKP